jgi:SAM-dependent methyltransferase
VVTPQNWNAMYSESQPPPSWETGRPQPPFVRLADSGLLYGRVLDAGCGTGEHALLAAARGADAVGIDISPRAIAYARGKAARRGVPARFEVADVLNLEHLDMTFDTVMDVGLFHVLDDDARFRYIASLASVLRAGGMCYLMCFSDRQQSDVRFPRHVRQDELRCAFTDGWVVADIVPDSFELIPGPRTAAGWAWLATIRRT